MHSPDMSALLYWGFPHSTPTPSISEALCLQGYLFIASEVEVTFLSQALVQ